MNRYLAIGLLGIFTCAVLLVGCAQENQSFDSEIISSSSINQTSSLKMVERAEATRLDINIHNVKIHLEKVQYSMEDIINNKPVVFTIINNWENDIDLSFVETNNFELEVQIDGKWYYLPPGEKRPTNGEIAPVGYLKTGESMEHTLQWDYYNYTFSPGHYRVAWISPDGFWSIEEFDIIE